MGSKWWTNRLRRQQSLLSLVSVREWMNFLNKYKKARSHLLSKTSWQKVFTFLRLDDGTFFGGRNANLVALRSGHASLAVVIQHIHEFNVIDEQCIQPLKECSEFINCISLYSAIRFSNKVLSVNLQYFHIGII